MIKKGRSIMAEPATRRMTLEEFLAWDDGTDRRYELWGGVVTAMAPPMPRHGLLVAALSGEIRSALRARPPCRVFTEAGIALPDRNDTFYVADLAVICEPLRAEDRLISNPVLIVEVLSPSTAATDRQIKIPDYRRIPSVQEILLIDSESAFAEAHRREGDRWINEIIRGLEATLALNSVPLTISMSELYEGIPLPDPRVPAVDMR
jgi:Uma2 family endonuclease